MPHYNEFLDRAAVVYPVFDGRVPLCNHIKLKSWLPIGGHVDPGEDTDTALFREIAEESGLQVVLYNSVGLDPIKGSEDMIPMPLPDARNRHHIEGKHWHEVDIFYGYCIDPTYRLEPSEHYGIHWFSEEQLAEDSYDGVKIRSDIRHYALKSIDRWYFEVSIGTIKRVQLKADWFED